MLAWYQTADYCWQSLLCGVVCVIQHSNFALSAITIKINHPANITKSRLAQLLVTYILSLKIYPFPFSMYVLSLLFTFPKWLLKFSWMVLVVKPFIPRDWKTNWLWPFVGCSLVTKFVSITVLILLFIMTNTNPPKIYQWTHLK